MIRVGILAIAMSFAIVMTSVGSGTPRAAAQEGTPSADCPATTEAENQAIIERYYAAVDAGDLEALREVLVPVIIQHAVDVPDARSADELITNIAPFFVAFPDLRDEIDLWLTDGDYVAARVIQSGTQEEEFLGAPATGRKATWTLIGIWRIACGRIAEHWVEVDSVGRLQQLGVLPAMGGAAAATATSAAPAAAPPASPAAECAATSEEENEALVRRWFDEAWTRQNFDHLDELLATDIVHHRVLNRITTDAASRAETIREWHTTMPDFAVTVDDVLTDGDLVLARLTLSGTHDGPWETIAPTGKRVTWTGHTIFRIACDRIAEEWSEADALAFFQQLGALEWPPTVGATPAA
jgi:predicted ester cyclase